MLSHTPSGGLPARAHRTPQAGCSADCASAAWFLSRLIVVAGSQPHDPSSIGAPRVRGLGFIGIVLAAVVIFEVVGPLMTRRALLKTGEENDARAAAICDERRPADVSDAGVIYCESRV